MKKFTEIGIVSFLMTCLSLISTFPLIKHFNKAIPWSAFRSDISWTLLNHPGDHLQVFYFFWLVKQNLLGRVPLNANPYEFNMLGGATAGNDGLTTAPLAFISFLFSPLGDIAAYNCTIISSYVLTGVFMYLLARLINPSKAAALLAAAIFTFVPIRINGIGGGNQYAFVLFMYPMIFYFMEQCIKTEKIRYAILAGLGIVGLAFNEPHLIYYLYLLLAGYLPIRLVSLIPASSDQFPDIPISGPARVLSWPPWLSLLLVYGAGSALVLYIHSALPLYSGEPLLSKRLWIMAIYYPAILLFFSILLAAIYTHLSDRLSLRQGLAIEAVSIVPLYLFLPMAIIYHQRGTETTVALIYSLVSFLLVKMYFLKPYLAGMSTYLRHQLMAVKRKILVFSPIVLILIGNAIATVIAKKNSISPSTESGGRTLGDVNMFSAHLQDLYHPVSSVYLGYIPILLGLVFLAYLLYHTLTTGRPWSRSQWKLPIMAFSAVVLLVSYALALGLALGNRSLYILFFNYVPFFNVPRVSDRIVCVTIFLLACVMAGVAGAAVHAFRSRLWKTGCSALIIVLTATQLKGYSIDLPMALTDLQPIEIVYQHIKETIGDGLLLELPLWPGDSHQSSVYQYYITLDKIKRINGYTPLVSREYMRTIFNPLHSLDRGFLQQQQYDLLRDLNVKYITVHEHRDIFTAKVSPHHPLTTVRRLTMSPFLEYLGPWPIINEKYDKVHERVFLFRVRETASSGKANDFHTVPTLYRPGGYLRQQTGRIEVDKASGRRTYHGLPNRDQPGFLTYGPYRSFFSGEYRTTFRLKCRNRENSQSAARIEVVRLLDGKPDILASTELATADCDGTYKDYDLDFSISRREQLGFRVFFEGNAELFLEKIVIDRIQEEKPPSFLEAERMPGATGEIVQAANASGKMAIEALPGRDKKGTMVYGTISNLQRGNYTALFYLRVPPVTTHKNPAAVQLLVTNEGGDHIYAKSLVRTSAIRGEQFNAVRLDFFVPEGEDIDYLAIFTQKTIVQLDGVEIFRNSPKAITWKTLLLPDTLRDNREENKPGQ